LCRFNVIKCPRPDQPVWMVIGATMIDHCKSYISICRRQMNDPTKAVSFHPKRARLLLPTLVFAYGRVPGLAEFSRVGMASPVGGGCRVMLSLFNDQRLRQCCRTDLIDVFLRAAEEQSIRHGRRWTGGHLPCGRRPGRGPKRDQAKSQCCSYDEPSNRR